MAQIHMADRPSPVRLPSRDVALGPKVDGALGREVNVSSASRDDREGSRGERPPSSQVQVGRGCCEGGVLRVFHRRGKRGNQFLESSSQNISFLQNFGSGGNFSNFISAASPKDTGKDRSSLSYREGPSGDHPLATEVVKSPAPDDQIDAVLDSSAHAASWPDDIARCITRCALTISRQFHAFRLDGSSMRCINMVSKVMEDGCCSSSVSVGRALRPQSSRALWAQAWRTRSSQVCWVQSSSAFFFFFCTNPVD